MLIAFLFAAGFIALMVPLIISEISNLIANLPKWLNNLSDWTMKNWHAGQWRSSERK